MRREWSEGKGRSGWKGERRKESEGRHWPPFMDPRYAPAVA